jgi:hypothetical protein
MRKNTSIVCFLGGLLFLPGCRLLPLSPPEAGPPRSAESVPETPSKQQLRVGQYLFLADFSLAGQAPLLRELVELREQVQRQLHLPESSQVIRLYLFESKERYEEYMQRHYPELPRRRAFFMAQQRGQNAENLQIYTYWGENVRQDLRHELTHALLHASLADVPLWLDEGLAEFFEVPPAQEGVNAAHLAHLCRPGFRPNLNHLEELTDVSQMRPAEYREAWAWVHLLLRSTPAVRQVLLTYLHELRSNPRPGPLGPRLRMVLPDPDAALLRHLADLAQLSAASSFPRSPHRADCWQPAR